MNCVGGQAFRNLPDHPLHLLEAPGTGIEVRKPQPSTQQLVATENVQRQIAVMVVVAMEEARFLFPMQGPVRGIQIHNGGSRRFSMGLQKERDQQFVDGCGRMAILLWRSAAGEPAGVNSSQFRVLFPARGSPRSRFPANTPKSGSCRSCS